jgi:hypothetical protein
LFGAKFIIAFIYILFILNFICTAPIQGTMGSSTAPHSAGTVFVFVPAEQKAEPEAGALSRRLAPAPR